MAGSGSPDRDLTRDEVAGILRDAISGWRLSGQRVLIIVPDGTRTAPIPEVASILRSELTGGAAALDFLVALGTHQPMSEERRHALVGMDPEEYPVPRVFNHEWWEPGMLVSVGMIPEEEVKGISGGLLSREVGVHVNRRLTEYDCVIVCGPVFPHEVVGFSGGNKYFFPGVSGPEVIDLSHWLGALITNYEIIGSLGTTPVRRLIDRAASMIPARKLCVALVVGPETGGLRGLYTGGPEEAWAAAAELSSQVHVRYVDRPYRQVLSIMPQSYEDIWTAAKGMYKLEPVVADGGEVVIYAPHITEFSYTHGKLLAEVGYHVRDYFLKRWEEFDHYPWTVLAHSTHLKGAGSYDEVNGERPRVRVTLATGISEERCREHNVGYRNPEAVDPEKWAGREEEGILMVPKAGEILHRMRFRT